MNSSRFHRIISLMLSVLLLSVLLAVPAMADEVDFEYWFDYLDYGYFFGDSNQRSIYSSGNSNLYLNNIPNTWFDYIDMVVYTDSTTLEFSKWGDLNPPLTKVNLGDGYFRFYGKISRENSNQLLFYSWENGSFIKVVSCNVSTQAFTTYVKSAEGKLYFDGYGQREFYFTGSSPASVQLDNTGNPNAAFYGSFDINGWQSMDYIQVGFFIVSTTLDTFNPQIGGISVPYSINTVITSERNGRAISYVYMLLDVSEFPRDTSKNLTVSFSGVVGASVEGQFNLNHCIGLVKAEEPSLWTHWFTQVGTWISNQTSALVSPIVNWGQNIVNSVSTWGQNIYNAITGNGDGDAFNQDVKDANEKLSNASDAMNDFTRPSADSVVPDLGDFDNSSLDILSQFFNNQLVSPMVTAGLAIWLIGIIFGV